jgi:hypothetical protein
VGPRVSAVWPGVPSRCTRPRTAPASARITARDVLRRSARLRRPAMRSPGAEIAGSCRRRRERQHTERRRSRLRKARLLHWAREHGPVHVTSRGQRDERRGGCAPRSPTGGPNRKRLPARSRRRRLAHPFGLGAGSPKVRGRSQSAQSPSGDCNMVRADSASVCCMVTASQSAQSPSGDCNGSHAFGELARFYGRLVAISPIPFGGLQRALASRVLATQAHRSQSAQSPSGDCNALARVCARRGPAVAVAISPIPFGGLQLKFRERPGRDDGERRNQPNPLRGIATSGSSERTSAFA